MLEGSHQAVVVGYALVANEGRTAAAADLVALSRIRDRELQTAMPDSWWWNNLFRQRRLYRGWTGRDDSRAASAACSPYAGDENCRA